MECVDELPSVQYIPTFKCILIGDEHVGKTSVIRRNLNHTFNEEYRATFGVDRTTLMFYTTRGKIRFNIWDTTGSQDFDVLRRGCYSNADCAIIMFNLCSRTSYRHLEGWHMDLTSICPGIPIALCGNKCEAVRRSIYVTFHQNKNIPYFAMSAKTGYNIEAPFLWLARQLLDAPDLEFVLRAPSPPEEHGLVRNWLRDLMNHSPAFSDVP